MLREWKTASIIHLSLEMIGFKILYTIVQQFQEDMSWECGPDHVKNLKLNLFKENILSAICFGEKEKEGKFFFFNFFFHLSRYSSG